MVVVVDEAFFGGGVEGDELVLVGAENDLDGGGLAVGEGAFADGDFEVVEVGVGSEVGFLRRWSRTAAAAHVS